MQINASIVLYNNDRILLKKAIRSFFNTELEVKLYLIDNSQTDKLKSIVTLDDRIEYIFNNKNLGFGLAHNIVLQKSIDNKVPYHLVLNPDVHFKKGVLEKLLEYMNRNNDVANVMPKVYYPNGKIQYLCKMLPTPIELIIRRFIPFTSIVEKMNKRFELHNFGYNKEMNIPYLSGCFMFLRTNHLKEVGLFDGDIFLHMEDLDLNRRLYMKYRTIFYPHTSIIHVHAKESHKRKDQLLLHIKSTIYYFNKWGWFFDSNRRKVNKELLNRINKG
ncbi:MAG: glycosyltransferase family 2 protein [Campylobacterota bacterium]|nr:glycosyltransferase family 2 protein [Campylobacterota bacterium]